MGVTLDFKVAPTEGEFHWEKASEAFPVMQSQPF